MRSGTDLLFGRFDPQHPPTALPGRPALEPIATGPFYAIPIYPMTRKSLGGIAVDLQCRVLNQQRTPIPNLYAAGEVTGFNGLNGKAGLEGTLLGPSILQGRILGQNLAKLVRHATISEAPTAAATAKHAPTTTAAAACESCHPLKILTATPRKGYWHFEQVHKAVLDRGWECLTCHADMSPFDAKRHRTDSMAQISACARCHLAPE